MYVNFISIKKKGGNILCPKMAERGILTHVIGKSKKVHIYLDPELNNCHENAVSISQKYLVLHWLPAQTDCPLKVTRWPFPAAL